MQLGHTVFSYGVLQSHPTPKHFKRYNPSRYLRLPTSSPWYFTNNHLHKDLKIPTLNQLPKL